MPAVSWHGVVLWRCSASPARPCVTGRLLAGTVVCRHASLHAAAHCSPLPALSLQLPVSFLPYLACLAFCFLNVALRNFHQGDLWQLTLMMLMVLLHTVGAAAAHWADAACIDCAFVGTSWACGGTDQVAWWHIRIRDRLALAGRNHFFLLQARVKPLALHYMVSLCSALPHHGHLMSLECAWMQ